MKKQKRTKQSAVVKGVVATGLKASVLGTVLSVGAAFAESDAGTASQESPNPWKADAEMGFLLSGGNTDTSSLNAKLNISRQVNQWVYGGRYETLRTKEGEVDTAKRYLLEGSMRWSQDDLNYLFSTLLHEDDDFSQYDFQTTLALGYGRNLINKDDS